MSEPLCSICKLAPRYITPRSGQRTAYCRPCLNARRREAPKGPSVPRPAKPPRPPKAPVIPAQFRPTASSIAKERRIASGVQHVLAEVSYSKGYSICSCSERFDADEGIGYLAKRYQDLADRANAHMADANRRSKRPRAALEQPRMADPIPGEHVAALA